MNKSLGMVKVRQFTGCFKFFFDLRTVYILLIHLILKGDATAQGVNIGIPPIWNFSKKIYNAGTQNWDAAQDSKGVLYWANNEGLLRYDGITWKCMPVANRTVVRSVAVDAKDRIFIGAQSEMGFFAPEKNGTLKYHSIVQLLPEDRRNFEDVWDIVFYKESIFFRTPHNVFQYDGHKITIHELNGGLTAMYVFNERLLVQKNYQEILFFENNTFQSTLQIPDIKSEITGAWVWTKDTILLSTLKNGLFYLCNASSGVWVTADDAFLKEKRIYTAKAMSNGNIALGTSLNGLVVLDRKRRFFQHLTKKSGLQNNNILSSFADRAGNLWLGLDSGIDCVVLDAPFKSIIPDGDLQGTGYSVAVFNKMLYLGVSNGLYAAPWQPFYTAREQSTYFQKVKASDGQVWTLNEVDNNLMLGHHEGTFRINGVGLNNVSTESGAWTFVKLNDEYLLGGNYMGLILYKKVGNNWIFDQKLKGLNESCRIMVKGEDGAIWVAHPYRGIYRVQWSAENKSELKVKFFNSKNGLPSDLNNFVYKIAKKAVFTTEKGIFRYDNKTESFLPDEDFNQQLGETGHIRYLCEDPKGNIWYVGAREVGMLQVDDFGVKKSVKKKVFPELIDKLVGGFEFIYPVDENNVFMGAEQGFIHYDALHQSTEDTLLQVSISQIVASGVRDTILMADGLSFQDFVPKLEAGTNNLRFYFSATDYKDPSFLQYQVKLSGWQKEWSDWSHETVRVFTNLSPGKYDFQVQAKRKDGRISAVEHFSFVVAPPWYASGLAFFFYTLAILGVFLGLIIGQKKKFESEKEQLNVQHQQLADEKQREIDQSKAAVSEIQNEKLEAEILFKNQELASATMHLVQKGEILLTIQENLNQILEKTTHPAVKKEIQQLLNLLNFDAKLDEDWEQFAFHFDQVHVDFLKSLRDTYPQLSINDHKLCAYLRMNLTTKEIAPLMNISVRGVEASRYRLRKKLDLPNEVNLTDIIMGM
jgi:ligand-binding sensor domain-containing protein/DNA-binding CsgD family transcriptional regulator